MVLHVDADAVVVPDCDCFVGHTVADHEATQADL